MIIDTGTRKLDFVQDASNPTDDALFEKFILAVHKMNRHPLTKDVLNQLPSFVDKLILYEDPRYAMSYTDSTIPKIGIKSSAWQNLHPSVFDHRYQSTVVHELLHGSVNVNDAVAQLIIELYEKNPKMEELFATGPKNRNFTLQVEHLYVFAGETLLMAELDGIAGVKAWELENPEQYLREKLIDLTDDIELHGIKESVDKFTPIALPGLFPFEFSQPTLLASISDSIWSFFRRA